MQYIAMERNNSFFLLQYTMKGELLMSIKSDNIELERMIKKMKSTEDFSDFSNDVEQYRKCYNDLKNNFYQYQSYFNTKIFLPSELNSNMKAIDTNVNCLKELLSKYKISMDKIPTLCSGEQVSNKFPIKYNVKEIYDKINLYTGKFNDEISSIKNTSKYYEIISNYVVKSIQYLNVAKGKYVNNEIEVDGSKKLTLFRSRVGKTSKLLKDFDNEINAYINKLKKIKKIDIQDLIGDTK